jgi:hypothetical protein
MAAIGWDIGCSFDYMLSHEIHVVPERFDVGSLIERLILGEVGEKSAGFSTTGRANFSAQSQQCLESR